MHKLLRDTHITDGLPRIVAEQPKVKALDYAIFRAMRRLLAFIDGAVVLAAIDNLPEDKLDHLALNLRAVEYRKEHSMAVKRELVKNALLFRNKAGTRFVTEEIMRIIFGESKLLEWWEYDDDPGYFMVELYDMSMEDEIVDQFAEAVEAFKRLSAWLRKIQLIIQPPTMNLHFGSAGHYARRTTMITMPLTGLYAGTALTSERRTSFWFRPEYDWDAWPARYHACYRPDAHRLPQDCERFIVSGAGQRQLAALPDGAKYLDADGWSTYLIPAADSERCQFTADVQAGATYGFALRGAEGSFLAGMQVAGGKTTMIVQNGTAVETFSVTAEAHGRRHRLKLLRNGDRATLFLNDRRMMEYLRPLRDSLLPLALQEHFGYSGAPGTLLHMSGPGQIFGIEYQEFKEGVKI